MSIKEIINATVHRPWPLPSESWRYYQEWNKAIFLHYQVDINELKKWVPEEIEIDLFEGKPWISLVAFSMEKIRPRYLPPFNPISNFAEINIRTYIKSGHKTGVYFLSIEGEKKMACKAAKLFSGLPYRFSKMKRTPNSFISKNREHGDQFNIQFRLGNELKNKNKSTLDIWLTERYALLQDEKNALNEFEIHHIEWPLQEIEIEKLTVNYPRFKNMINNKPDKINYSPGVQVTAWGKNRIRGR